MKNLKTRDESLVGQPDGESSPLLSPVEYITNDSNNQHVSSSMESSDNHKFPYSVFFIVGQEFCERFSFYGMKTVLYFYLRQYMGYNDNIATTILHSFVMFAYFFPLVGGILSDSLLGKYKTILYLSLVYSMGNVVLALSAIPGVTGNPPHWWGLFVGLLLLAIGTGGIKPCVSAFGGDQFHPSQTRAIQLFFSMFYFSVNSGSLLSTLITPELRETKCYGQDCYALAFGVPAILMIAATLIFVAGSKAYKITPPGGNVVLKMGFVSQMPQAHWLDVAVPKFGRALVEDTKSLLGVLFMFLPLPLFWALFDQQSSRWVAQANHMDLRIFLFGWEIKVKPDQMQSVNAFLILIMIPLFERLIYPLVRAIGINFTPLRRMSAGMFLAGASFLVAALLQSRIDKSVLDQKGTCLGNCISIGWQIPQYIILTAGEILLSITGLEFAYSQAPDTMKSVCQAAWLLTVSVGNLLVVIIAGTQLFSQTFEFVFFAALIFVAMLIFSVMAMYYQYRVEVPPHEEEARILGDVHDD